MNLYTINRGVSLLMGLMCASVVVSGLGMRGDAGVFPVIAGSLGVLASAAIGLGTLRSGHTDDSSDSPALDYPRLALWTLCIAGLLGLMVTAGTFVALPLFLLLSMRWLAHLRWLAALIVALAFTGLIYAVFVYLLDVPLPAGWLAH